MTCQTRSAEVDVQFVAIWASNANVVVASVDVFFVLFAVYQMLRVTFAFRKNLHVFDFQSVFKIFGWTPRKDWTSGVINVVGLNAGKITVVDFGFKHQKSLWKVQFFSVCQENHFKILRYCLAEFQCFWRSLDASQSLSSHCFHRFQISQQGQKVFCY